MLVGFEVSCGSDILVSSHMLFQWTQALQHGKKYFCSGPEAYWQFSENNWALEKKTNKQNLSGP